MIATELSDPTKVVTTSRAHVTATAVRHDLQLVPAGDYLYTVRKVPLLGQPIVYRARVTR